MKFKILITIFLIAIIVFVAFSANRKKPFEAAEDFSRDALVFVQVADLPKLIKIWNESELKENYAESANFYDFQNNHLGRKLASRFKEFGTASGFAVDLEMVSGLALNSASLAIYDIGKLEFVFIAPMSEEVFLLTKFAQNQSNFTEETLSDGTKIYRANVEADRGRQKQELIFTHFNERFILTTREKLLVQTLGNISGKDRKNRLSDEVLFANLSREIEPKAATIWVNQTRLNDDYYFKRYWLMSAPEDLKNIRAGIFDFEIADDKLIERRKFLLENVVNSAPISTAEAKKMATFLPASIPFYCLEKADAKTVNSTIEKTFFELRKSKRKFQIESGESFDFEGNIDEAEKAETFEKRGTAIDFSEILKAANPNTMLHFTNPEAVDALMFIEFKRGAVFRLRSPDNFNRGEFEAEIARRFSAQFSVSAKNFESFWETKTENNLSWRELKLPMSAWQAVYVLRGDILILANDSHFLQEIISSKNDIKIDAPMNKLTVINFLEKDSAYTKIFARLKKEKVADEFFTGNIESLLDAASNVEKIEIRENYSQKILEIELRVIRK